MPLRSHKHLLAVLGSCAGLAAAVVLASPGGPTSTSTVIPYAGHLDRDGAPVSVPVDVRVTLFGRAGGVLFTEEHLGVAVSNGRFAFEIGRVTALPDALAFDDGLTIGLAVRGPGDADYALLEGRQALRPSTYAVRAAVADALRDPLGLVPAHAVMPFNLTTCPAGWAPYLPARGRFIRGIDSSGQLVDPAGQRAPGNLQGDELVSHNHTIFTPFDRSTYPGSGVRAPAPDIGFEASQTGTTNATGGAETRPRNVALLYCEKL